MQAGRVPNFRPSANGLRFVNSFESGIPVTTITIPVVNISIPVGDASNGMCGGMVYAVLDFFLAQPRLHPPATTDVPGGDSPLTGYIGHRLIDSFALWAGPSSNAYRYIDLMSTLDHDTWVAHGVPWLIAQNEWPKIKADIDAGRPSPLGLVSGSWVWPTNIAAKIDMLKHCHQVLAYSYDLDDQANLTLLVYDPNGPGEDNSTISMNLGDPSHSTPISTPEISSHLGGESFRAFFRHDFYTTATPDPGLSPGPFLLDVALVPGDPIQVGQAVTRTVSAVDEASGQLVTGTVWRNSQPVGETNSPFTTTYQATYHRQRTIDPETHQVEWRWVGPIYPVLSVTADDYDRVTVPAVFTGGSPPPDDDA
jgi:hypothetical protein